MRKKPKGKYYSLCRTFLSSSLVLLLFLCGSTFVSKAADVTPPYLVNPIPEPGSTTDNWFIIRTGVLDDDSGVNPDPETISVTINGAPPRVKPIIESSYGHKKGIKITMLLFEEQRSYPIKISVRTEDLAENPNVMNSEWSFFPEEVSQNPAPIVTYPENYRWLEYNSEKGHLIYSWISSAYHQYYRIRYTFSDNTIGSIDLGPYSEQSSYQSESFSFELPPDLWSQVAALGQIAVDVAPIDKINGIEIADYSTQSNIIYINEDVPTLIRPYHSAVLDSIIPPIFEWQPVESPVEGYVVVFVRLDDDGLFTEDVKVFEVPLFIKRIPLDTTLWGKFMPGTWAWAVVARTAELDYSNFMIYRFLKD